MTRMKIQVPSYNKQCFSMLFKQIIYKMVSRWSVVAWRSVNRWKWQSQRFGKSEIWVITRHENDVRVKENFFSLWKFQKKFWKTSSRYKNKTLENVTKSHLAWKSNLCNQNLLWNTKKKKTPEKFSQKFLSPHFFMTRCFISMERKFSIVKMCVVYKRKFSSKFFTLWLCFLNGSALFFSLLRIFGNSQWFQGNSRFSAGSRNFSTQSQTT